MNKRNFHKEMEKIIKGLKGEKPKLLMHSCCAPCSTSCIEKVKDFFDLTVFYYNPNIDSQEEYSKRSLEQEKYCRKIGVNCLVEDYRNEEFMLVTKGYENEFEGGCRCEVCYRLRLNETAKVAKEKGFDYFTTTLTVSPLKNATLLNSIGEEIAKGYGLKYLPSDFKKDNGYLRSVELSKLNEMYRQNYCGCIFSKNKNPIAID